MRFGWPGRVFRSPPWTCLKPPSSWPAQKQGLEGFVWVGALIDAQGQVAEAVIQQDANPDSGFGKAALAAAKKCRYKPAIDSDGKPVAVWVSYKVVFSLAAK